MFKERSFLDAEKSEKYMGMLGKHFARKVPVKTHGSEVHVNFPWGLSVMRVDGERFHFHCEASSKEALEKVKSVINEHIYLLKDVRGVELMWEAA